VNALKTSDLDLRVPVFASLLSDQLLSVGSHNSDPLRCRSSFVFVASNSELSWQFPDTLGHIVDGLHRVDVCLSQSYLEVLWLSCVTWLPFSHLHLLAGCV